MLLYFRQLVAQKGIRTKEELQRAAITAQYIQMTITPQAELTDLYAKVDQLTHMFQEVTAFTTDRTWQ